MALPALILGTLGRMVVPELAGATAAGRAATGAAEAARAAKAGRSPQAAGLADEARRLGEESQKAAGRAALLNRALPQMTFQLGHGAGLMAKYVGHLNAANTAVAGMAEPVRKLVALANPAKARLFEFAMTDAQAVVGRSLIPVMDAFTRTARKVGDAMAGLEPVLEPVNRALASFVDTVGTEFYKAVQDLAPAIYGVTQAIQALIEVAEALAKKSEQVRKSPVAYPLRIANAVGGFLQDTDHPEAKFDPRRTSFGAAAREARFVGAKAPADEAIRNALMIGATGKQQKTQEQSLDELNTNSSNFFDWVRRQFGGGPAERSHDVGARVGQQFGEWRKFLTG